MDLRISAPPPGYDQLLLHTLWLRLPTQRAFIPACLSPSIMLIVRGSAELLLQDGSRVTSPRFFLRGPYTEPVHVEYAPDTIAMSVCFIPGMLAKNCKVEVGSLINTIVPLEEIFDAQLVARFLESIDAHNDADHHIHDFHHFLSQVLVAKQRNFIGEAFMAAHQKIFFPLMDLTAHFGIGERQLERRVRAAFGINLRELRRIARFGYTVQRIIKQGSTWGDLTRVAQESGYYDQAHMHKEFNDLAGVNPTKLLQRIAAKDPAYWLYLLSPQDFKKLFIAVE